jgi:hypothetical protein
MTTIPIIDLSGPAQIQADKPRLDLKYERLLLLRGIAALIAVIIVVAAASGVISILAASSMMLSLLVSGSGIAGTTGEALVWLFEIRLFSKPRSFYTPYLPVFRTAALQRGTYSGTGDAVCRLAVHLGIAGHFEACVWGRGDALVKCEM